MLTATRTERAQPSIMHSSKAFEFVRVAHSNLIPLDMAQTLTSQPPQAYGRFCEMLSSRGGEPAVGPPLGQLTRVLATSRPGGVFLCLGRGAGEMATWIMDGMDLSGRLVAVLQNNEEADMLRALLADDMRITVHVQDAAAFLSDVRDHRFDLITDLNSGQAAELTSLALGRLALGAFYLSPHRVGELTDMLSAQDTASADPDGTLDADSFAFAQLPEELAVSLIVRGPHTVRAKRRGGRRARQGVTPLFSSSPPRRR